MPQTRMRLTLGGAALATLAAACGGKSTQASIDEDLQRDLQLAGSSSGIELLPGGSRTGVVSAIEQTGVAEPAAAPTRTKAPAARPKARRITRPPRVVTAPVPRDPQSAPRPIFGPDVISPPPPGGYKTVGEVIRNAPFPIKP